MAGHPAPTAGPGAVAVGNTVPARQKVERHFGTADLILEVETQDDPRCAVH
jgi:hypothetical protein